MKRCYPQSVNAPYSPSIPEADEQASFNLLKLQMLEAFYHLDVALEDWIHDGGGKASGASTGYRLEKLIETSFADEVATKAQVARFHKLPDELAPAIRLRNLLVHSEVRFGVIGRRPAIFLRPVCHTMRTNNYFAAIHVEDAQVAIKQVESSARTLNFWRDQRDKKARDVGDTSAAEVAA